jgi:hypothetical protein
VIDVQVTDGELEVVVTGKDAVLLCEKSRWEVTVGLEHVLGARVGRPVGLFVRRHSSNVGGLLTVAQRRGPTLAIDLDGDPYVAMILSVGDPQDAVATIKGALRLRHR